MLRQRERHRLADYNGMKPPDKIGLGFSTLAGRCLSIS